MAYIVGTGQKRLPCGSDQIVEPGRSAGPDESLAALTCTTWFEYNGDKFGEQTFTVEPAVCGFDDFLRSLYVAQATHPGFRVVLQR